MVTSTVPFSTDFTTLLKNELICRCALERIVRGVPAWGMRDVFFSSVRRAARGKPV